MLGLGRWMLGLGLLCYQLGWPGTVLFVALLAGGGVWLFNATRKKELDDWQKLERETTGAPPATADEEPFWAWVKVTLFLPILLKYTPDDLPPAFH